MFTEFDAQEYGAKGGRARTEAKAASSRKNGKAGGRKATRTLAERLLRRKITLADRAAVQDALDDLLAVEIQALADHFQTAHVFAFRRNEKGKEVLQKEPLNTNLWRAKSRRVPKRVALVIKKFRLNFNYYCRKPRAARS